MKALSALLLPLLIYLFLPLPEDSAALQGLDPERVRLGATFFSCIAILWMTEALPLAITALFIPVLAAAMGLSPLRDSLPNYAAPLICLLFGGFALAAALTSQDLDRRLARKLVQLGRGNFLATSALLFVGTALLSMWMSNTATAAMMIPLALGILRGFREEGIQAKHTYFMLLGLAYSASLGGIATLIGTPANAIAARQLDLDFFGWLKFGLPIASALMPIMFAALYLILRPPNMRKEAAKEVIEPLNRSQWITLVIFAIVALSWINSARIAPIFGLADADSWIAMVAVFALAASRVVTWQQIEKNTGWGVLLLFGGGLALSSILGESGTSLYLARHFGEAVEHWPTWAMIGGIVAFVIFLTELSSNTATTALLAPIFYPMALSFGLAPEKLVIPIAIAASCAFMLPVATPPNAIAFGTGLLPQKQMMRAGVILNVLFIAVITLLMMLF